MPDNERSWWFSFQGLIAALFIAVIGFFVITQHAAHLLGVLPWLLFLSCPLMHVFMHHGHHSHHKNHDEDKEDKSQSNGG